MSEIEQVVRPFQLPANAPPTVARQLNQQSHPPVFIICGRNGQGKLFSGSYHVKVSRYMDVTSTEQEKADT